MEPAEPAATPAPVPPAAATPAPTVPASGSTVAATPAPSADRTGRSPRDMALSLAVLLVPIVLLLGFYRVVLDGDAPVTVDPASAFAQARGAGAFPVDEPRDLGADWQVSSASFRRETDGSTLRIGYLAPDGAGVLLVQSNVPAATLVPAEVGESGTRTGTYRTASRSWLRYDGRSGEEALVHTADTRTVLVVGAAAPEHLERLVASLD